MGVSRQTVNAIETGKYSPSLPLAIRLARYFGMPVEEVVHVDEGDSPQDQLAGCRGRTGVRARDVRGGRDQRSGVAWRRLSGDHGRLLRRTRARVEVQ